MLAQMLKLRLRRVRPLLHMLDFQVEDVQYGITSPSLVKVELNSWKTLNKGSYRPILSPSQAIVLCGRKLLLAWKPTFCGPLRDVHFADPSMKHGKYHSFAQEVM